MTQLSRGDPLARSSAFGRSPAPRRDQRAADEPGSLVRSNYNIAPRHDACWREPEWVGPRADSAQRPNLAVNRASRTTAASPGGGSRNEKLGERVLHLPQATSAVAADTKLGIEDDEV